MKKLEVVTVARDTTRRGSHAVGAHVAVGHAGWGLHWLRIGTISESIPIQTLQVPLRPEADIPIFLSASNFHQKSGLFS